MMAARHRSPSTLGLAPKPRAAGGVVRPLPFEGDEAALVSALRAEHPGAAARLYEECVDRVHGLVFRILGLDPELDDVVNDTFVAVFASIDTLRDPRALRGWVLSIAVRSARRHLQRRKRRRWLLFFEDPVVHDTGVTPDFEGREALRDLYALLDRFPVDERLALVLHRVEGLSLREASEASRMSSATFKRRLARAEMRLKKGAAERPSLALWLESAAGGSRDE
jgi:RNA polymerase sigma-70 factor (ECF subfamily)